MKTVVDFLHRIGELKQVKRAGWGLRGIAHAESVADHSYRVAMMVLLFGDKQGVDVSRALKIALVHDLAEVIVGDYTPHDAISREEKARLEREAMLELVKDLEDKDELMSLWEEYEQGESKEAQFVKECDKIEAVLQSHAYKDKLTQKDMEEFFSFAAARVKSEWGKKLLEEVER